MSDDWTFFPHVMTMHDLQAMREAVRLAQTIRPPVDPIETELLAWIVFRYYRRGLTDPARLAAVAVFLSGSRVMKRQRAHTESGVVVHLDLRSHT
jgi:hypothetical protein